MQGTFSEGTERRPSQPILAPPLVFKPSLDYWSCADSRSDKGKADRADRVGGLETKTAVGGLERRCNVDPSSYYVDVCGSGT